MADEMKRIKEKPIELSEEEEKQVQVTEWVAREITDIGDKFIREKGFVGGVVAEEAFVPGLTVAHIYIKDPAQIPSIDVTMKYRRDHLGPREVKVKLVEELEANRLVDPLITFMRSRG